MKQGVYFVSGIDTDAGKSYAVGILARRLMDMGESVVTQKFIQTGGLCENGISLDINVHREIMGCGLLSEDIDQITSPVVFSYPSSPHLAAEIDNSTIDFTSIELSTKILSQKYDYLFIEGAGGLMVPLTRQMTTIDYIEQKGFKLILVTSGKLGSINHTLLSLEACRARNIEVAAVVYNHYFTSNNDIISNDTLSYIQDYCKKYHPTAEFIEVENLDQ